MGRPKKTQEERMKYFKEKNVCKPKCEESFSDSLIAGILLVCLVAIVVVIFSVI